MVAKQSRLLNFMEPRINYNSGVSFSLAAWKRRVAERDKNTCQICMNRVADSFRNRKFSNEAHHVVPRHHGGKNTLKNGVTLCKFCHHYFDFMYFAHGLDYHQITKSSKKEEILDEVVKLMKKRYFRHLLSRMYPLKE